MSVQWSRCARCQTYFQAPGGSATCPACSGQPQGAPSAPEPGWFYANTRQKVGPVSQGQLQELAARGQLQPGDMVLRQDSSTWVTAGAVPGLFEPARLGGAGAVPPPPCPAGTTVDDAQRTGPHQPSPSLPAAA